MDIFTILNILYIFAVYFFLFKQEIKITIYHNNARIYGQDYKERLESVGFKLNLYDIKKDLSIRDIKKYGLNKDETLYVCKKL